MLSIIFTFMIIWITIKMIAIGLRAMWGIAKILLPMLFVGGLVYAGLMYLALPIMAVLGIILLFNFVKV